MINLFIPVGSRNVRTIFLNKLTRAFLEFIRGEMLIRT